MQDMQQYIARYAGFLVPCWLAAVVGLSILFRRSRGRTVFALAPPEPLFVEKWTSGRSLRSFMTRIGGARNCLFVALSRDRLIVQPHFPFSLGFLPEIYGLDWDVPVASIHEVRKVSGFPGKRLRITMSNPASPDEPLQMELFLRAPDAFLKAAAAVCPAAVQEPL